MRYVDEDALIQVIETADEAARSRKLNAGMRRASIKAAVRDWLGTQPTEAPLNVVGLSEAAEMMGVAKQRIYRYEEQERMPAPLRPNPVDEQLVSGPLFSRPKVEELAQEIRDERDDRERRRAEREREAREIQERRIARERKKKEMASA